MNRRKQLKLSTPQDTRRSIARIANMVLNGELDPKCANTILYACNAVLAAIRVDEQQTKLEALEQLVERLQKKREGYGGA